MIGNRNIVKHNLIQIIVKEWWSSSHLVSVDTIAELIWIELFMGWENGIAKVEENYPNSQENH